jgi:hypothetical protein
MKDSFARIEIKGLQDGFKELREELEKKRNRDDFFVRYCPKCKHNTMQKERYSDSWWMSSSITISTYPSSEPVETSHDPVYYTCLNCGIELKCTTEKTCKPVEKKKPTKKKK